MQLNSQIKRGYLGIVGLLVLSSVINLALITPSAAYEFVRAQIEHTHCKNSPQARWKLASTPLDLPVLPLSKIKLCRA